MRTSTVYLQFEHCSKTSRQSKVNTEMQFLHIFAVLASLALSPLQTNANPITPSEPLPDLQILSEHPAGNGTITFYGLPDTPTTADRPMLPINHGYLWPLCKSNLLCDSKYLARESSCRYLLEFLRSNNEKPSASTRSACHGGGGRFTGQCCTSWDHALRQSVRYVDLVWGVETMMAGCMEESSISSSINQGGAACARQCLSNRPNGC